MPGEVWRKGDPPTLLVEYTLVQQWYGVFLKKLKTELPYDPAIPLLGLYLEKNKIWKDVCTAVFIAALFTIPNTQDMEAT